ncbi:PIN domain-containing protein [Phascolarctobacterium sp.]|uniref:PIN domain-containing protein n=1 Tax=Phascolarctobacterium sp. TaxID=2049039 RepID=UPI0030778144
MASYEKAFIYFDTNALECRHSGKALFLSQFMVNPLYYEIEKIIQDWGLSDKVQICIPEIVWLEMHEHLIEHFKSEGSSMITKIESYRKSFGDLIDLSCEFKEYSTETEYKKFLCFASEEFLKNPRVTARIVPCPKDENTITEIIEQAVHASKPFKCAKINGKNYTDAGFKDALIFNTIVKNTGKYLGVLISNDNDFSELFSEKLLPNLKLCSTSNEVQVILSQEFGVMTENLVKHILQSDDYLIQRILTESDFPKAITYNLLKINYCAQTDDGIIANFMMEVDGEIYIFNILYNVEAKELLETSYEFEEVEEIK